MKASRPKPKRAPAAKKVAAQKKKHKIFKPRRTRGRAAAKRASKRKPNAQAARKAAAIASLPGSSCAAARPALRRNPHAGGACAFLAELHRRFDGRAARCWPRAPSGRSASTPANCPISARDRAYPRRRTGGSRRSRPICSDRRVEITGPVDRKMIINALNSGAKVFMADFEDANSPTWANNHRGPDQPEGPLGRQDRLHRPGDAASTIAVGTSPRC